MTVYGHKVQCYHQVESFKLIIYNDYKVIREANHHGIVCEQSQTTIMKVAVLPFPASNT